MQWHSSFTMDGAILIREGETTFDVMIRHNDTNNSGWVVVAYAYTKGTLHAQHDIRKLAR